MKFRVQIKPLYLHSCCNTQTVKFSFSSAFMRGLITCWKDQDQIYNKKIPAFYNKLQQTPRVSGALDNHQKIMPKKNINDDRGAVVHVGMTYYVKQNKPSALFIRGKMLSPNDVKFTVSEITIERQL